MKPKAEKNTTGKPRGEKKTNLPMIGGEANPPAIVRTLIDHSENGGPVLDITDEMKNMEPIFAEFRRDEAARSAAPPWVADDGFDWSKDDSVVLKGQRSLAIYENECGDIVIRGQQDYPEEDRDPFFIVGKDSLERFIQKLRSFL